MSKSIMTAQECKKKLLVEIFCIYECKTQLIKTGKVISKSKNIFCLKIISKLALQNF